MTEGNFRPSTSDSSSALLQPLRGVLRVIGDHEVRAGSHDARQDLENDSLLVDPSVGRGGLDHCVFAGDVVSGDGSVEAYAGFADNVEVGKSRLDHDRVGSLLQIQGDLVHGQAG